jgi:hypothetical protein
VCTVYAYTVYGVLFSPLWLKSEPGWPAISVSTSQQFRVGQIVWFGCLSAISQDLEPRRLRGAKAKKTVRFPDMAAFITAPVPSP